MKEKICAVCKAPIQINDEIMVGNGVYVHRNECHAYYLDLTLNNKNLNESDLSVKLEEVQIL